MTNFVERVVPFYAQCLIEVSFFFFRILCCCWITGNILGHFFRQRHLFIFRGFALCISFIMLQNSVDGKISTSQLRLAYSTLVRSAAMTSTAVPDDAYALAWFCIQLLVDTIRDLPPLSYTSPTRNPKGQDTACQDKLDEADTMKAGDDRTH